MNPKAKSNPVGKHRSVKKTNQKVTRNEHGALAFVNDADRALYNVANMFKFRNGSYLTANDKVKQLTDLIRQNVNAGDVDYVMALSWFLGSTQGLRLSPTVMLSDLIFNNTITSEDKDAVKLIVDDVFTRPDFLATSAIYYKMTTGRKSFATMPSYYKEILRNKLSKFSEITLKKRKMKSRDVKLADLIKVLKPYPSTPSMSRLYKNIIENNSGAALQVIKDEKGKVVKADSAVAVLSSDTVSKVEKTSYLVKNIEKIAINELIRNLTQFPESSYNRIERRLISAFSGSQAYRFVNPFDLVLSGLTSFELAGNRELRRMVDRVLMATFCASMSFNVKHPTFLVDVSGSMNWPQHNAKSEISIMYVMKYLALIMPIVMRSAKSLSYYNFNTSIHDYSEEFVRLFSTLEEYTPNAIVDKLAPHYKRIISGGTSLRDCTMKAIARNPNTDALFVFSDEVSWADRHNISNYQEIIPARLHHRTFVFNVLPTQKTMFSKEDKVTLISGINANCMYLMNALLDFPTFKENLVKMFNDAKLTK